MFLLMPDRPLLLSGLLEHAERQFSDVEIVARDEGPIYRYTYRDARSRARAASPRHWRASAWHKGERVATLAWNSYRHLEPTSRRPARRDRTPCNPRLYPDQLAYIVNHAEDR